MILRNRELFDEMMLLIKDTPGLLTQTQIDSLRSSMDVYQAKATQLKAVASSFLLSYADSASQ